MTFKKSIVNEINYINQQIEDTENNIDKNTKKLDELINEKKAKEELLDDYSMRGFAIGKHSQEKIDEWEAEHNCNCRNRYIDYIFTPTELGTALTVKCSKCRMTLTGLCCSSDPLYADTKEK